ncbi:Hypothetical predicted protein [Pelobates cultripes]|uniref:Uncharacterized protein n=1 Tax=Pelobates cultripes TaxID=61616 RepID=A0AAD1TNI4_PELCU|nr:Hypothetical predicted protein [Pelobates cultripes]
MPTWPLTYCIPTFNARPWHEKGLHNLTHFYTGTKLTDFAALRSVHGIPQASHFSYRQLQSFLRKYEPHDPTTHEVGIQNPTLWEQICLDKCLPKSCRPHSMCYKLLLEYSPLPDTTPVKQWSLDLKEGISQQTWNDIIISPKKLVKSATLLEQHTKMIYRWHLVPARLHKLYQTSSPQCWRCASHVETPPHIRKIAYHLLLTAQRVIVRNWKSSLTPAIEIVLSELDNQRIYEQRFTNICPPTVTNKAAWEAWETWRQTHRK